MLRATHRPPRLMAAALLSVLLLSSCTTSTADGDENSLTVYATTGYLADAVANIAPEAMITTMVGPGGDPHTYQPSTRDIQRMQSADDVFWNGLHLEAQMIDQLESLGDQQLAVGEKIPQDMILSSTQTDGAGNPLPDPHIWNSPAIWSLVVGHVADKLSETDPENAAEYAINVAKYLDENARVAAEAEALLERIPQENRILITGHDAFAYFGESFDLEVHATDFISPEARLSASELSDLADLITDEDVSVIFQDNLANPQAITSLKEAVRSRGSKVEISGDELYADSLGAEEGLDTYQGVFLHNARAVSDALVDQEDRP